MDIVTSICLFSRTLIEKIYSHLHVIIISDKDNTLVKERNTMKDTFRVIDEQGQEVICDVLFTFDSEETHKSYIVYTDNTCDNDGNIQVFASIYDPTLESPRLEPIETEKEWKVIETILDMLQKDIRSRLDE